MRFAYEEELERMPQKYRIVSNRVPLWRRLLRWLSKQVS